MQRFKDKVALVTGAGSGLGRAGAQRLADEGASVAVVDRDEAAAAAVVAELTGAGHQAIAITADVTDAAACEAMVAQTTAAFGKLDVVFANAGIGGNRATFVDMEMTEWDRVLNGNLRSIVLTCKAAVPALIANGSGAIVLMGSSTGGWDTIYGSGPIHDQQRSCQRPGPQPGSGAGAAPDPRQRRLPGHHPDGAQFSASGG